MREIPRILAIEPNSERARALVHLVHDYVEANVVVSASGNAALAVMARRMPELVLLSPFTPPADEQSLMTFLRERAHGSVPVLIMSSSLDQLLKKASTSSGIRWLSRRRAVPTDMVRDALGARVRSALKAPESRPDTSFGAIDMAAAREEHLHVPRARRWSTPDGSPLSVVRLDSGFAGQLVNISSSGLLLESESVLMPGDAVMFEFADPQAELKRIWRPDMNLTVPAAHVIRSEVSKIAPDRYRYRVAARFVKQFALFVDRAVAPPSALPDESADTLVVEGDGSMRATAARLRELARALESFQSAIIRMCPPASEATRAN